jgi:hypothetical protein
VPGESLKGSQQGTRVGCRGGALLPGQTAGSPRDVVIEHHCLSRPVACSASFRRIHDAALGLHCATAVGDKFGGEMFFRSLFCFVLNQHRSRPNKTYAGQKKSQILSSWTKPPFEAPQSLLSPNCVFPFSTNTKTDNRQSCVMGCERSHAVLVAFNSRARYLPVIPAMNLSDLEIVFGPATEGAGWRSGAGIAWLCRRDTGIRIRVGGVFPPIRAVALH